MAGIVIARSHRASRDARLRRAYGDAAIQGHRSALRPLDCMSGFALPRRMERVEDGAAGWRDRSWIEPAFVGNLDPSSCLFGLERER
jgi:hypothetical protein